MPTIAGLLTKYILYIPIGTLLFIIAISYFLPPSYSAIFALLTFVIVVMTSTAIDIIRFARLMLLASQRSRKVEAALPTKSYSFSRSYPSSSPVFDALETWDEGGDATFRIESKEWFFADYQFHKYTETKHGRYLSSRTYYSIIQIPLPRQLPHIVFDSRRMRGREMRFSFDKDQQIQLEGNFDTYFDTYFPAHYEIDLLSIITPEVMQALMAAGEFDIEVYGNQLKLYAPMLPASKVPQAIQLGLTIRDKLLHNINTYSDDRLAVDARNKVHTYGATIQDNFRLTAFKLALGGLFGVGLGLWLMLTDGDPGEKAERTMHGVFALLLAGVLFIGAVFTLRDGYKERERRRKASSGGAASSK